MSQTQTQTVQTHTLRPELHLSSSTPKPDQLSTATSLPKRLAEKFSTVPKLSKQQCGHLRHFHNLASGVDGDWPFMGAQESGQEWDTAYRYQVATMTYAAGAAHYHRSPAMRGMFKELMMGLIMKMLRREVWGYWYLTSQSGIVADPDLKELRKPWANPVCRENIMYSGHLLLMVSLYTMLFNDDHFDQPESIVFDWNPLFFGMGRERYTYTRSTLQETIIKEMERENWMGVCCEPNMVFIICNQFPLIAMRYNDVVDGTKVLDEVLPKYKAAWEEKGMLSKHGLFRRNYAVRLDKVLDTDEISHSAWVMAFMPWNPEFIQSIHPTMASSGFLQRVDNRINLHAPVVTNAIKDIVAKEGGDPDSPAIIKRARDMTAGMNLSRKPYLSPTFGYVSQWFSEIAGSPDLDALLRHADTYLKPTWYKGGLYYARSKESEPWDKDGNYTYVDPYTGNAAIGYARLNVKNGQKQMFDHPWTKEEVESRPWVDGVQLGQDVDCLRGRWDEEEMAMLVTLRTWNGSTVVVKPVVKNLPAGTYGVFINGDRRSVEKVEKVGGEVVVELEVGEVEVDLILLRV
ncbi:uncharacterized protein PAC_13145 [Phialocephala subalpina]|uniref:Linalool dehydratase/isomerase domain-containing protein n=1 Tax=Phialocephala subalpina TaxID=576137 RepID=A0A1L7XE11_9HELO|nr:uncharacterized protein PAC_13145 [Phialocephala subalpina]